MADCLLIGGGSGSGSGGDSNIRFNAATNYIQVYKGGEWYNWQYFDPTESVELIPTMTSNSAPYGTASVSAEPFSGQAFNAFDGSSSTKVYGARFTDNVDVMWINTGTLYSVEGVKITLENAGTTFSLYGHIPSNDTYELIYTHAVTNGVFEDRFTATDYKYDGFSFRNTDGSSSATPAFISAQVYGRYQ